MSSIANSIALFNKAQQAIPGGVNSPVRAFKSVGGNPIFIKRAQGAYLYDADGNQYLDFINSWGPAILGHAHPYVTEAIQKAVTDGISFGAPTELEIQIAELIKEMVPGIDKVRMVNSGTEACMSALRLARGYTGKNKFIKLEGCYHGHADAFLVKAGSGVATLNIQSVPGIPHNTSTDTLTAPYNDIPTIEQLIADNKNEIAAIILEPVAGNMGCVPPMADYLTTLRHICTKENILLIFDEVMTGFRLAAGGAQELYGIKADIVAFGKVIGGGMPVGAYCGSSEIMNHVAPAGKVYQAGTLSGNPIAMTAGYATLSLLHNDKSIYNNINNTTQYLKMRMEGVFSQHAMPFTINSVGSMLSLHFGQQNVYNFADATQCNIPHFNAFFHYMLKHGVYLPPSAFETWFVSNAITKENIDYCAEMMVDFCRK
ncbi:MAG: glutamate-1-semialdehyde-2,1-aminomutase [Chitinophagia bacterium]|nr:glutamate-1-semialdehyde-2,1-aminomutase [Chitinophagia bacterium]